MNDNIDPEGPRHAASLALINDLMIILHNAGQAGLERYTDKGDAVFDFAFWSQECAKQLAVSRAA
jgi:hypothetical protein